jgi:hypothetical protein
LAFFIQAPEKWTENSKRIVQGASVKSPRAAMFILYGESLRCDTEWYKIGCAADVYPHR